MLDSPLLVSIVIRVNPPTIFASLQSCRSLVPVENTNQEPKRFGKFVDQVIQWPWPFDHLALEVTKKGAKWKNWQGANFAGKMYIPGTPYMYIYIYRISLSCYVKFRVWFLCQKGHQVFFESRGFFREEFQVFFGGPSKKLVKFSSKIAIFLFLQRVILSPPPKKKVLPHLDFFGLRLETVPSSGFFHPNQSTMEFLHPQLLVNGPNGGFCIFM